MADSAAPGPEICGVLDKSISNALKIYIKQDKKMVCGIIGPGTSRTLAAKWDSPMEQTNVGDQGTVSMAANGLQAITAKTSITSFSSTQIWQGNMPLKFSLNLIFIALSNAVTEVMQPLKWLEEFASPDVNNVTPGGRIPGTVIINIGRQIIVPNCVIENISTPLDKERDRNGNLIRAEVQLDIQTKVMLNKAGTDGIGTTWKNEVW
jgi:hypothetical protein